MLKTTYIFGTEVDYDMLADFLKTQNVVIIDTAPKKTKDITIIEKISEAKRSGVVLLNTDIMSIEEYSSNNPCISGYYHYAEAADGIIQLLKSEEGSEIIEYRRSETLKYGRLFANCKAPLAQKWANKVFSWVKKNSKKVYRTTPNMRVVADDPERNFYCFPDAAKKYNGENGSFLKLVDTVFCIAK